MTKDQILPRRQLGDTGLSPTIFGMGGVQLGDYFVKISQETACGAVEQAWIEGIRYFDVAPKYGQGLSEHRMGTSLREYPRDDFVISTKAGLTAVPDPTLDKDPGHRGLRNRMDLDFSYDGAMRQIEGSLNRLGLSRIDIVYLHDLETRTYGDMYPRLFRQAMGGTYKALDKLRSEGVISAIGGGLNEAPASIALMNAADIDCLMFAGRYTLLEQQTLDDVMALALKKNVGIIIGAPFNTGVLATGATADARYNNQPLEPELRARVEKIEQVCANHSVPLPAAAMQFTLAHPATVSLVAGISNAEEVSRNISLVQHPIPADFWTELRDAGLLRSDAPVPEGPIKN